MIKINEHRQAEYPIDNIYLERWSPRSFANKDIEEDKLNSLFEAARWAPSAANWQPWRFVFAQSKADRDVFLSFINENNVEWCKNAPVLVAIISKTTRNEAGDPNLTHSFDTGTAWGFLALEATRQGLITHGMGGFSRDKAMESLKVPENYVVDAIVAIGYQGDKEALTERHQEREYPSTRNPIEDFVFEGKFVK